MQFKKQHCNKRIVDNPCGRQTSSKKEPCKESCASSESSVKPLLFLKVKSLIFGLGFLKWNIFKNEWKILDKGMSYYTERFSYKLSREKNT
ncbi:hypothetical protein CEXT_229631 [Caerostris extrusa]|uniref:Uncharacterized protein n=1 Tax=Caerostris extrusa TaxID=172846 RepID=A0AAV4PEJ9_CAEEX|nr:hypothetical protein CEXT_229631 [Caerostris extrusa]